jgi:hypothetical protein
MSEDMEVIDGVEVLSPSPRFIRLTTIDDARAEMARVYRDMRAGKIPMEDGTKLVYVLSQVGRLSEVVLIEKRVKQMQQALERAGIDYVSKS